MPNKNNELFDANKKILEKRKSINQQRIKMKAELREVTTPKPRNK